MDARTVAAALSAGRVLIGVGLTVATRRSARSWLGSGAVADPGARVAIRGLGARDLSAGAGVLVALGRGADDAEVRRWLVAAVIGDTVDAVATMADRGGHRGGRASAALAATAALAGSWAASRI